MREFNHTNNWIDGAKHHLLQVSKGVLIAGLTFAGYGIWKRWLGEALTPASAPEDSTQAIAPTKLMQATITNLATKTSAASAKTPITSNPPINRLKHSISLADELEISFHSQKTAAHLAEQEVFDEESITEEITVIADEEFHVKIPGYKVGKDGKTYFFGTMFAGLIDDLPLPNWLSLEPPAIPFTAPIIGSFNAKFPNFIAAQGNLVLLSSIGSGGQLINVTNPAQPTVISRINPYFSTIRGNKIFALNFETLQVIDIADPRYPVVIGTAELGRDTNGPIIVNGDLVITTAMYAGIKIAEIKDLTQPVFIGTFDTRGGFTRSVAARGNLALVATTFEVAMINITNPKNPVILGKVSTLGMKIAVQENVALADVSGGFVLLNIIDPAHPTVFGTQKLKELFNGVTIQGDLVMVASASGLTMVNITDPRKPSIVGTLSIPGLPLDVSVQNNLAHVLSDTGLKIVDLSGWSWKLTGIPPQNQFITLRIKSNVVAGQQYQQILRIRVLSRPYIHPSLPNLQVKTGEAFSYQFSSEFLDLENGVIPYQSLNFSLVDGKPLPPWLTTQYSPIVGHTDNVASKIAIYKNLAFVTGINVLRAYNITDLTHPVALGSISISNAGYFAIQENLAFVTTDTILFHIVNITNPNQLVIIATLEVGSYSTAVAVRGNIAFVLTFTYQESIGGLRIVNITDPVHPKIIGETKNSGSRVAIEKNIALTVDFLGHGLEIINITDLAHPQVISSVPGTVEALDVTVKGNIAFVNADAMQVVNFTDPLHPVIIGSTPKSDSATGISVQNKLVFRTVSKNIIQMINVTDLTHPTIISDVEMPGNVGSVIIRDNVAFVGTTQGLQILKYGLSAGVLTANHGKTVHGKYQILITARNYAGILGNATFWISINNPPIWKNPIPTKTVNVGQVLAFQLPEDVFWDKDGDTLIFNSSLSNGARLPNWITFFALGQIYTIIPSSVNRGQHNICVTVNDDYFGKAQAWFKLIVPTRKPVKTSDIATQNAFIWRWFELFVSSIFMDPDGDPLSYRAQLKGARPLPGWLHFDNTTCMISCRFFGKPGVTDLTDLEVELIATGPGGDANAEFSISMRTSTLFQDLATYYSVSGAGLVVLSLFARFWRWQKMRKIHTALNITEDVEDEKEFQITYQTLETHLQSLLGIVERRQTQQLMGQVSLYCRQALAYSKQHITRTIEIGDPWEIIEKIVKELERRAMYRFNYETTFIWVEALHQLLKMIIQTESGHRHAVLKSSKEHLLMQLAKIEKYIQIDKSKGIEIKQQLSLCYEALISMNDTDSLKDNLVCRDSEMLLEIIKTMVAPPYGIVRLLYQIENIPSGWYPIIIQLCHLAEQAQTNNEKLTQFQNLLHQQKNWRVVYEGVGLLGKVARDTPDEKILKQALDGIQPQTKGLNHYQNYRGFLWRCSPCCDKQSTWIRVRAQAEVKSTTGQGNFDAEADVNLEQFRQPLLQIQ